jgi:hypothetical protein
VVTGGSWEPPANLEALIDRLCDADYLPPIPSLAPEKSSRKMGELLVEKGVAPEAWNGRCASRRTATPGPLGEILIQAGEANPRDVGQILSQKAQAAKAPEGKGLSVEETIRVPVQRLDLLIDAIGESVIAQSMVWADPRLQEVRDLSLEKKIAQASLMLRQIQELSMSLRMVGIRSTFQKMSRLVRDLARKLDKQIELCMEGEDTELDKTVVENIGDPLVHMVRNSVDHGIEFPADRIKAGKPPQGRIHACAPTTRREASSSRSRTTARAWTATPSCARRSRREGEGGPVLFGRRGPPDGLPARASPRPRRSRTSPGAGWGWTW